MNGPTHTVGSHSDDRGGESDWPCYCDQNVAPSNSKSEDKLKDLSDYLGNTIHVLEGLLEGLHEANEILEDGLDEIEALERPCPICHGEHTKAKCPNK